jgi:hypothetical protein
MRTTIAVAAALLCCVRADDPTYTVYANLGSIYTQVTYAQQGNSVDVFAAAATTALGVGGTNSDSTCNFGSYAFAVYQNTSQTGWT